MAKACIFAKSDISSVLSLLNREYKKVYGVSTPQNVRLMKIYAKMAVIALGGWIEDGMKNLMGISIDELQEVLNQNNLKKMVGSIYGFSYEWHVSKMIVYAFGAHGLEYIESEVGDSDIARLSSSLGNLKTWRDNAAHSHATVLICNPEMVIRELNAIFPILKKMERGARTYRNLHF